MIQSSSIEKSVILPTSLNLDIRNILNYFPPEAREGKAKELAAIDSTLFYKALLPRMVPKKFTIIDLEQKISVLKRNSLINILQRIKTIYSTITINSINTQIKKELNFYNKTKIWIDQNHELIVPENEYLIYLLDSKRIGFKFIFTNLFPSENYLAYSVKIYSEEELAEHIKHFKQIFENPYHPSSENIQKKTLKFPKFMLHTKALFQSPPSVLYQLPSSSSIVLQSAPSLLMQAPFSLEVIQAETDLEELFFKSTGLCINREAKQILITKKDYEDIPARLLIHDIFQINFYHKSSVRRARSFPNFDCNKSVKTQTDFKRSLSERLNRKKKEKKKSITLIEQECWESKLPNLKKEKAQKYLAVNNYLIYCIGTNVLSQLKRHSEILNHQHLMKPTSESQLFFHLDAGISKIFQSPHLLGKSLLLTKLMEFESHSLKKVKVIWESCVYLEYLSLKNVLEHEIGPDRYPELWKWNDKELEIAAKSISDYEDTPPYSLDEKGIVHPRS